MIPELNNLLWVVPGVCFLFAYHRLRDVESVEFSNWSYVFFIVLIGVVTILPIESLFESLDILKDKQDIQGIQGIQGKQDIQNKSESIHIGVLFVSSLIAFLIPFFIRLIFEPFVEKLDQDSNFFIPSTMWSILYFFFPLENRDKFIKNCIDYEGEAILVTVDEPILIKHEIENKKNRNTESAKNNTENKNNKVTNVNSSVFLGILLEFPYVATRSIDSHAIRILPLLRGYQYIESKERIKWIKKYTLTEASEGLVIPRTRIIHFCAYDPDQHDNLIFKED